MPKLHELFIPVGGEGTASLRTADRPRHCGVFLKNRQWIMRPMRSGDPAKYPPSADRLRTDRTSSTLCTREATGHYAGKADAACCRLGSSVRTPTLPPLNRTSGWRRRRVAIRATDEIRLPFRSPTSPARWRHEIFSICVLPNPSVWFHYPSIVGLPNTDGWQRDKRG